MNNTHIYIRGKSSSGRRRRGPARPAGGLARRRHSNPDELLAPGRGRRLVLQRHWERARPRLPQLKANLKRMCTCSPSQSHAQTDALACLSRVCIRFDQATRPASRSTASTAARTRSASTPSCSTTTTSRRWAHVRPCWRPPCPSSPRPLRATSRTSW